MEDVPLTVKTYNGLTGPIEEGRRRSRTAAAPLDYEAPAAALLCLPRQREMQLCSKDHVILVISAGGQHFEAWSIEFQRWPRPEAREAQRLTRHCRLLLPSF